MARSFQVATACLVALLVSTAHAQPPAYSPVPNAVAAVGAIPVLPPGALAGGCPTCPPLQPAPVLWTRLFAPPGVQATFFRGADVRNYDTPTTIALRPGYVYRFQLSGFENHPKATLFPTLEVIGTLQMPPPLCASSFPTPIVFTPEDIEKALRGVYISKVIFLENPDKALPIQTKPELPLETEVREERELLAEARLRGRPLLIVRFGERQESPEELAAQSVDGTMMLPGDGGLGPPAAPPPLAWGWVPLFDPFHGPKPLEEECMHDGGDTGTPVGFDAAGQLRGLDPSDTVAEYADDCGKKHIAISNRVCVCVPRFGVIRLELVPAGYEQVVAIGNVIVETPPVLIKERFPPRINLQIEQPEAVVAKARPSSLKEVEGPITVEQLTGTGLVIGNQGSQVVIGLEKQKCEKPCAPLVLTKCVDKKCAQIGDVVTFTLKYTNPGGQPITDVVVSDSLTARLEYVPGSAKSEREAVFTTQENEAGSTILRWQIKGVLQPGVTAMITFQVRIR